MSNYVKATDFASKDALITGDPLKVVSGTEIDDEYNAIQTAINSKSNTNSPTLTGVPSAPTPTEGTNTTQLSTTSFVTTAIATAIAATKDAIYPVGSIYSNATNGTNPATLLGFGTWTAFGAGRVLVGLDGGNALFDAAEEAGGSYNAINVAHAHSGTTTGSGSHAHSAGYTDGSFGDGGSGVPLSNFGATGTTTFNTSTVANHTHTFATDSAGSSGTNANIQPYITVYMWKRVS